jgi:site-specific recombinase XerD
MASALREQVLLYMRLRGLSPRTVDSYIHAYEALARYYWKALDLLTCRQVQAFLDYLITQRKLEWATVNVYFSAYRLLYEKVLDWGRKEFSIPPRGRSGKRPGVLSRDEVFRLINTPRQLKHRCLLHLIYGSGLRVSEAVRIQPRHIDRGRMMLRVEQGKGHKDRYTILAKCSFHLLEEYWRRNGEMDYFFFGREREKPMSTATAQKIYYKAREDSGVRCVGGIHVLRHCFATHLMEAGTDIYTIRKWMGHRNLITTARYMHVTAEHLATVKSPLDDL